MGPERSEDRPLPFSLQALSGPGMAGDGPAWLVHCRDDKDPLGSGAWSSVLSELRQRFPSLPRPDESGEPQRAGSPAAPEPGSATERIVALAGLLLHPASVEILPPSRCGTLPRGVQLVTSAQHQLAGEALQWAHRLLTLPVREEAGVDAHLAGWLGNSQRCCGHPLTQAQLELAHDRGIPIRLIDPRIRLYQLGTGARSRWIRGSATDSDAALGAQICNNKQFSNLLLQRLGIATTRQHVLPVGASQGDLERAMATVGIPCVVKPIDAEQGKGVHMGITTLPELVQAFTEAGTHTRTGVLLEALVRGADHRVAVIGGKIAWVVRREPPEIVGEGNRTAAELLEEANAVRRRLRQSDGVSGEIPVDPITLKYLRAHGLELDTPVPQGLRIRLRDNANMSTGGRSIDVTEAVHPSLRQLASRIARTLRLTAVGIDVVTPNITVPLEAAGGAVIELNFNPQAPPERAALLVEHLFPAGIPHSIPTRVGLVQPAPGPPGRVTTFLEALTTPLPGSADASLLLAAPKGLREYIEAPATQLGIALHFYRDPQEVLLDASCGALAFLIDLPTFQCTGLPLAEPGGVLAWLPDSVLGSEAWKGFSRRLNCELSLWRPTAKPRSGARRSGFQP